MSKELIAAGAVPCSVAAAVSILGSNCTEGSTVLHLPVVKAKLMENTQLWFGILRGVGQPRRQQLEKLRQDAELHAWVWSAPQWGPASAPAAAAGMGPGIHRCLQGQSTH